MYYQGGYIYVLGSWFQQVFHYNLSLIECRILICMGTNCYSSYRHCTLSLHNVVAEAPKQRHHLK